MLENYIEADISILKVLLEIGEMLENYIEADISILKVLFDHFLNFFCLCWLQSFAFW